MWGGRGILCPPRLHNRRGHVPRVPHQIAPATVSTPCSAGGMKRAAHVAVQIAAQSIRSIVNEQTISEIIRNGSARTMYQYIQRKTCHKNPSSIRVTILMVKAKC